MEPQHATPPLLKAFSTARFPREECRAAFEKALTGARHEHAQVVVACLGLLKADDVNWERAAQYLFGRYPYLYPMSLGHNGSAVVDVKAMTTQAFPSGSVFSPVLYEAALKISPGWNEEDVKRYREGYLEARAMVQSLPQAAIAQIFLDVAVLADYSHASVSQEAKANLEAMKEGGEEIRRLLAPLYNKR